MATYFVPSAKISQTIFKHFIYHVLYGDFLRTRNLFIVRDNYFCSAKLVFPTHPTQNDTSCLQNTSKGRCKTIVCTSTLRYSCKVRYQLYGLYALIQIFFIAGVVRKDQNCMF